MSEQSATVSSSYRSHTLVYIKRKHITKLLHEGYQYLTKRKHQSGLIVWQCTRRPTCKGRLRIKVDKIVEQKPHTCTPDFAKNVMEETRYKRSLKHAKKKTNQV